MSKFYDEDGIDGPFERGMAKPIQMEMEASCQEYFDIKDKGKAWHLFCKECGHGYELKKPAGSQVHVGNVLHLLNHAKSHKRGGK